MVTSNNLWRPTGAAFWPSQLTQVYATMANKTINILFEYLYRDASNWKQHGKVVFTKTDEISSANIEARILAYLEDSEWFIAEMVDMGTCFIGYHNSEDDHHWHEFEMVSEFDFPPCDPAF